MLYAGGGFTAVGGQPRNYIAALDNATSAATSWNPNAGSTVYALAVDGGIVYAGGFFVTIGGQVRNRIAALDVASGAATGWNPNPNNSVFALSANGGSVYTRGWFNTIGGQPRTGFAVLDTATGAATSWDPNANSTVYDVAVGGGAVIMGGEFTSVGGMFHPKLAAVREGTTSVAGPVDREGFRLVVSSNPAPGASAITFTLARAAEIDLGIYDLHGRRVCSLQCGLVAEGRQRFVWDGRHELVHDVAAGVYFVRLVSGTTRLLEKVVKMN